MAFFISRVIVIVNVITLWGFSTGAKHWLNVIRREWHESQIYFFANLNQVSLQLDKSLSIQVPGWARSCSMDLFEAKCLAEL